MADSFIPASNEPSGRACTASWRMPLGSNTALQCCMLDTPLPATGYLIQDDSNHPPAIDKLYIILTKNAMQMI